MNKDEFTHYWLPARRLESTGDGLTASQLLAKKLGIKYDQSGDWRKIRFTPQLKNLLLGLVGPHRETIIKIYQIRKGRR